MYNRLIHTLKTMSNLENGALDQICTRFSRVEAKQNQILLAEGEVCKYFYFVNQGCMRLFTVNDKGVEATRMLAFEGSYGTAWPSLIDQTPAMEYLQTIEHSELLRISRKDFFALVDTLPAMASIYRHILERSFVTAQRYISGIQGFDPLQLIKNVLQCQPDFLQRISNKMAASYLGLSPESLSKLKRQL